MAAELTRANGLGGLKRYRLPLFVTLVLAVAIVAVAPIRAPARSPNILIIVVDTLRADRLGVTGNTDGLTPFLDELAARGTTFSNVYASSSWTCPSVASLLSSRYPSQHGVVSFDSTLAESEVTLGEILEENGYVGGGFSSNFRISDTHGYAQGFSHWRAYATRRGSKVRGERLRSESVRWVERTRAAKHAPMVLYLQFMEPHTPYEPPEPYRSRHVRLADNVDEAVAMKKVVSAGAGNKKLTGEEIDLLKSLYDGEVAAADAELRALFADLQGSGFLDDAIIVVTADHGEEFGEHNEFLHGITLYNTAIHVPLIVVAPGIPGGRVVPNPVSLLDVTPTILDLVKIAAPATFEGQSLVPLMTGSEPAPLRGPILSELEPFSKDYDFRRHQRALVSGTRKLILNSIGNMHAFELKRDPNELRAWIVRSRNGQNGDLVRAMEDLRSRLTTTATAPETSRQPLDESTKEKLRALGYQP
jgi:choline-sulfatase